MRSRVVLAALLIVVYAGSLMGAWITPSVAMGSAVSAPHAQVAVVRKGPCDSAPIPC